MTTNIDRARWAERCVRILVAETGVYSIEHAITDLIANLGHLSDEAGLDFLSLVAAGIGHWHLELSDEYSIDALPRVDIRLGEARKLAS